MIKEYFKKFNTWNEKKKFLEKRILPLDFFFLKGEVWWAALGVNIGHEIDGKNELFERPIIVLKKVNEDLLWALPITRSIRTEDEFYLMKYHGKPQMILTSQIRMISSKRLLRLIFRIREEEFLIIKKKIEGILSSIKTIPSG